jgi:predicted aspartyl protease
MANKKALVDLGATDNFMHLTSAKRMGLGLHKLLTPKNIFNIDNTTNKSGKITHYLDLDIRTNGIHKEMRFLIMDIEGEDFLLGYPWLSTFKPKFHWRNTTIDK